MTMSNTSKCFTNSANQQNIELGMVEIDKRAGLTGLH